MDSVVKLVGMLKTGTLIGSEFYESSNQACVIFELGGFVDGGAAKEDNVHI